MIKYRFGKKEARKELQLFFISKDAMVNLHVLFAHVTYVELLVCYKQTAWVNGISDWSFWDSL